MSPRVSMKKPCNQFLPRSGFPLNHYRISAIKSKFDLRANRSHSSRTTKDHLLARKIPPGGSGKSGQFVRHRLSRMRLRKSFCAIRYPSSRTIVKLEVPSFHLEINLHIRSKLQNFAHFWLAICIVSIQRSERICRSPRRQHTRSESNE